MSLGLLVVVGSTVVACGGAGECEGDRVDCQIGTDGGDGATGGGSASGGGSTGGGAATGGATATGGGSSSGGGATCNHTCSAVGVTSCTSGQLQTCAADVNGCRAWNAPTSCASGFCESATSCGACNHTCSAVGVTSCTSGQLQTCAADVNGCRAWNAPTSCASGFCESATSCGACNHTCSAVGVTSCTSGQLQTCAADVNGCRAWNAPTSCASGFCESATSCGACNHTCSAVGVTSCTSGQLQTCAADVNGCRAWNAPTSCASGFCESATSCGACNHTCSAVGVTSCTSGQLQTCAADVNGCRAWNAPTSCASGLCQGAQSCDVDECATGTASCQAHSYCTNTAGGYRCDCSCGWTLGGSNTCVDLFPRILFVDANRSIGGNGDCWSTAFKDLQAALAAAQPGDELWVAKGTYLPGTTATSTFTLRPEVALYGGFAGTETARAQRNPAVHKSLLSGTLSSTTSSYHVVTAPSAVQASAILDGFSIEGGKATGATESLGGGLLVLGSPTIRSCTFASNQAEYGAAVFVKSGQPVLESLVVKTNFGYGSCVSVQSPGVVTIRRSTFQGNGNQCLYAEAGSVLSAEDSTFTGFAASWGAAYFGTEASATFTRSTFTSNTAYYNGGSIYSMRGQLTLKDSIFDGNVAWDEGGGAWISQGALVVEGTTFKNNSGSGLWVDSSPAWTLKSSRFEGNKGTTPSLVLKSTETTLIGSTFASNSTRAIDATVCRNVRVLDSSFLANGGSGINMLSGKLSIARTLFRGNTSDVGGALNLNSVTLDAANVVFDHNVATIIGGAISCGFCTASIVNSRFSGNQVAASATSGTGSALDGFDSEVHLTNTTFVGNFSAAGSAVAVSSANLLPPLTATNCAFWDNVPLALPSPQAAIAVSHSCLQQAFAGTGNVVLAASPFVDADGADNVYGTADDNPHLSPVSPCTNAGLTSALPSDTQDLDGDGDTAEPVPLDLDGSMRVSGASVDVGAYEVP